MKYLLLGAGLLIAGSIAAVLLNFQGASCLTQLSRIDRSTIQPEVIDAIEQNCFIITNSYVYSIFVAAAGAIVLGYHYLKRMS